MDIAKIRKKAKEKEEKARNAEEGQPQTEVPAEPGIPVPSASPQGEEGPAEEAGQAAGDMAGPIVATEETIQPPPPETKEGERGFSDEKESGAEGVLLELVTFSIANEEFAFRVPEVEEIIRFQRITKLPTMPEYVRGITSLRGKIIPVLDLRKRLGLKSATAQEEKSMAADGKILILDGPKGMIGATIDRVLGVVRFEEGTILDPPGHLSEGELRFIEGVVILEKRFISIIRSYDALDIELTEGG